MKRYGIYVAYPPTVDLRAEGLGRLLAEFLSAAQERGDIAFVIACPSWMQQTLRELFEASGVSPDSFEVIAPPRKPVVLTLFELYARFRKRRRARRRLGALWAKVKAALGGALTAFERALVGTRSIGVIILLAILLLPFALVAALFGVVLRSVPWLRRRARTLVVPLLAKPRNMRALVDRVQAALLQPKADVGVVRWYRLMMDSEVRLIHELIAQRTDIAAWYSPTAFWPHFNAIRAPRLMCVPDVVLANFPAGFAQIGGDRVLESFRDVEAAINGGQHFVTYSEDVKWGTLVERYFIHPDSIAVIPHGANRLDELVSVSGFPDNAAATDALCRRFFDAALTKAVNAEAARNCSSQGLRFIFYASQFRPNKNVISLLRAYDHLLKRRYVPHKLVLTGTPDSLPGMQRFLDEHHLHNDVLCLYRISAPELAACYRLADLAVNPSFSEGGCPFTLTEALSVGTPAVMARIAVTEEFITDPELRDLMLFDPYDWRDMAARIEWGLVNRELLLHKQRPLYERFARRTWRDVVQEHVALLDGIAASAAEPT